MEQAVINSALYAQRKMIRQQKAYDAFIKFLTTFGERNRAARRRVEKPPVEVLVGGSLLVQSLVAGLDTTALQTWQKANAAAKARKKAGAK
jgi:uncharacterized membrane-anchored protein